MPAFHTEVPHTLGQDQAVQRLKDFVVQVAQQYQEHVSAMDGQWSDNRLTFSLTTFGLAINGMLTVTQVRVRVEGQLPFAALPFRGRIQNSIADELRRALA